MSREKVFEIYNFVDENLYYNIRDLEIKERKFNSMLLFSILTCLVPGKQLIVGEPGLGKTTTSEYISCLFYSLPLEVIYSSEIHGNPEQTEEKMIGRPDLGKLSMGYEEVIWSSFSQLPVKIVDEINRLPPSKQDILLDSVDRGIWSYLNDVIINVENCLFATANFSEGGGFELTPRMLDRFDVMVESKHPGSILAFELVESKRNEIKLKNPKISKEIIDILKSKIEYDEKIERIKELSDTFSDYLDRIGIPSIKSEEREKIRREISEIKLDRDAEAFSIMLISELSFCKKFGQKRVIEDCPEDCHYSEYLCSKIRNCISNRFPQSLINYSKALAWFLGNRKVDIEHISLIAPYALAHRLKWKDRYYLSASKDERSDTVELYLAKTAVEEVLNRYREQSTRVKTAFKVAFEFLQGKDVKLIEGDHPIYDEIRKVILNY